MLTINEEIAECDRISVELAEIRATFVKQKQEEEKAKTEFKVHFFKAQKNKFDCCNFSLAIYCPYDDTGFSEGWKGRRGFNTNEIREIIIGLKRLIGDPVDGN